MRPIVCVDFGSTFTKAAVVDVDEGCLLGTASSRTTAATDVMHGWADCRSQLSSALPEVPIDDVRACSSAGGGLRLAVVGYERAITAEAGRMVGLSAGARVVHVASGRMDSAALAEVEADRPDVVLLVGGTDGGNAEVLLANAEVIASSRLAVPMVVAGNVEVRAEVVALLKAGRKPVLATANVLPSIGQLDPRPAREAIREVFVRHVIGGKHLSQDSGFASMVRAATPDAVLAGVELLADGSGRVPGAGDVVVVDIGGATTDVYSVVTPDPEESTLHREVVEVMWRNRTVEGDLGVRWNATAVVEAALAERLIDAEEAAELHDAAALRAANPGYVAEDASGQSNDVRLATLCLTIALRRHARPALSGEVRHAGKDLRSVTLVVGSGGVLRHAFPDAATSVLSHAVSDHSGGWKMPEGARTAVDVSYVLAAAGLLSDDHPESAARLLQVELSLASNLRRS